MKGVLTGRYLLSSVKPAYNILINIKFESNDSYKNSAGLIAKVVLVCCANKYFVFFQLLSRWKKTNAKS